MFRLRAANEGRSKTAFGILIKLLEMDWLTLVRSNYGLVRQTVELFCARASRPISEITVMAVTKNQPQEAILAAKEIGLTYFGENRVQEARDKVAQNAFKDVRLDLIGNIQSNKIKVAVEIAQGIQSLDRAETARELSRRAQQAGKTLEVLLEMNTSEEEQKFGVRHFGDLERLAENVLSLPNLKLKGLMTMAAFTQDEKRVRASFAKLYQARESLSRTLGIELPVLSMGMSSDYHWAILEGSTLLRLGTALFGSRS